MSENYDQMNEEERLRAENDFIKMKLMLEKDAHFGPGDDQSMPAGLENIFLKNVVEFEKQFENRKTIKVFDKIGQPAQFKPAAEIPDTAIDAAWKELEELLHQHGVGLSACSPNVSNRELYRFTVEELFLHEMDDINVPGLTHEFIYDEFYPDPVYDNTRHAIQDCIAEILDKKPIEFFYCFNRDNIRLNQYESLSIEEFKEKVNIFKNEYQQLDIKEITSNKCMLEGDSCFVQGEYVVKALSGLGKQFLAGNWEVEFILNKDFACWDITGVKIEGVQF